jgi:hypothetical protein
MPMRLDTSKSYFFTTTIFAINKTRTTKWLSRTIQLTRELQYAERLYTCLKLMHETRVFNKIQVSDVRFLKNVEKVSLLDNSVNIRESLITCLNTRENTKHV